METKTNMTYTIWVNIWETLGDRTIAGYSIKKVMAIMACTTILGLTIYYTDKNNLMAIIPMWQTFIMGLVITRTFEKVKGVADKPDAEVTENK